jgi:hypothetical protein
MMAADYIVPPASARRDGDFVEVVPSDAEWAIEYFSNDMTDLQIQTPPENLSGFSVASVPISGSAFPRLSWAFDAAAGTVAYETKITNDSSDEVDWLATPGWFEGAGTIEWTMPDLSGIDGWATTVATPQAPWRRMVVILDVADDATALLKLLLLPQSILRSSDLVGLTAFINRTLETVTP